MSNPDQRDVAETLRGDGAAYARLMARHQPRVAAYMWKFTRDVRQCEELVHDTFVAAYLSLGSYRGDAPLEHWLVRIATRVGYRFWKHQAKRRQRGEVSLADWEPPASDDAAAARAAAAEWVHQVLALVPPRDRLVLTLLYVEGCSIEETAQRCGWSRTMTKVQAFRARNKLKKAVGVQQSAVSQTRNLTQS